MQSDPIRPTPVLADPEQWSEASKRSYTTRPTRYNDVSYVCRRCGASEIYTAQAQREALEVRKVHVHEERTLCLACFHARVEIRRHLGECVRRWESDSTTLSSNQAFLSNWLRLLEEHTKYGARFDLGNARMIRDLLSSLARSQHAPGA